MRLIYVTEQLYLHGGAEKILTQKLNYWADVYNYDVLLITSEQNNNPICYPLSKKVKHIDLNIGYNNGSYFNFKNIIKFPKHFVKLRKEIKKFNPNAIFLISLTWIRFALPLIAYEFRIYNEYHTSYYGFKLGYNNSSALGKIKKIISENLIKIIENYYTNIIFLNIQEFNFYRRKNGVIIPNFFDNNIYSGETTKKNQVISLGRMSYQKGYDMLLDAWAIVDDKIIGWELNIYGNGENKEILKSKMKAYNFQNKVHINDAISDVNKKLSESQFYVMSSRFETFPMVLLEALSNGLPVISFDCPTGPKSILTNNEDGILVEPNNIEKLAKKIHLLIENYELRNRMSKKAKTNVIRFKPEFIMPLWDNLINKKRSV
tara:strand:- start:3372 stop:4496 length:1125 start_codon:yes stop_codon:yes gene_type:complete